MKINLSTKQLWIVLGIIFLSYGTRLYNPFLEDLRNILSLVVLAWALIKTFKKKK